MKNSIIKNFLFGLHKCNQLDNRIVKGIGKLFNFDAEKYCSDYGIIYNIVQVEDNPVPSLNLLKKAYTSGATRMYDISRNRKSFTFDGNIEFEAWCKENGVETDKEQPKFRCELEKPDFNKRIVIYENDKVVSTSGWNHPEGSMFHIYNGMEFTQHGYNGAIYWRFITEESKNNELKTCRELLAQGKNCGNCVNYCTMSGVCIN